MNRVQNHFEFEFPPQDIEDELLTALSRSNDVDRELAKTIAKGFPSRVGKSISKMMEDYKITDDRLPTYYIVVTMVRFTDDYFVLREPGISVIGLGNWERSMAPPSIFEFIQMLVMREAIAGACPKLQHSIHLGSKGCICDFNWSLEDVRLKVISGFLCHYCRHELDSAGFPHLADEVARVLDKKWIGDLSRSTSVAHIVAKLGVNLFMTKGLVPSWGERLKNLAREDGARELVKLLFVIIAAALIYYLGLKGSP